jgi:hypothetical protein
VVPKPNVVSNGQSVSSSPRARQMTRDVPEDAGFLRGNAAVLRQMRKWAGCIIK